MSSQLDDFFAGSPQSLSASDVASLLGVGQNTVYKWLNAGVIPGYRLGTTWVVLREELKAALAAGANGYPGEGIGDE